MSLKETRSGFFFVMLVDLGYMTFLHLYLTFLQISTSVDLKRLWKSKKSLKAPYVLQTEKMAYKEKSKSPCKDWLKSLPIAPVLL